jgi:ribosomal protein L18
MTTITTCGGDSSACTGLKILKVAGAASAAIVTGTMIAESLAHRTLKSVLLNEVDATKHAEVKEAFSRDAKKRNTRMYYMLSGVGIVGGIYTIFQAARHIHSATNQ